MKTRPVSNCRLQPARVLSVPILLSIIAAIMMMTANAVTGQQISYAIPDSDVPPGYSEVRTILDEYYRRVAKKHGQEFEPKRATILNRARIGGGVTTENTKSEMAVNRRLWNELFEYDIVLTPSQAHQILLDSTGSGLATTRRGRRQAQPGASSLWPNGLVFYEFAWNDVSWQQTIRAAIQHIEEETCVRFQESNVARDRLQYFRGGGCYSNVGRMGGVQLVSIGDGCQYVGIVAHETLHGLGLWHEQSRYDRDSFISIAFENVLRGTQGNFEKRTTQNSENYGQPYDLGSVMHYASKAFSYDWYKNTINTVDPRYQTTLGQRERISYKDARMINIRYCSYTCPSQLPCQNSGYTDPNNCSQCKCPPGYGGALCDTVAQKSCGGQLQATAAYQTLDSGPVTATSDCAWRIIAAPGQKIEVIIDRISFLCRDTCQSFVEMKWTAEKTATGARFCCSTAAQSVVSESNDFIFLMQGEDQLPNGYLGFAVRYRAVGNPTAGWQTTTTTTSTTTEQTTTTEEPTTTESPPTTTIPWWWTTSTQAPTTGWWQTTTPVPATTTPQWWQTTQPSPVAGLFPGTGGSKYWGAWSQWGAWGECSLPCGGCGVRQRLRACYLGQWCTGTNRETGYCGTPVCSQWTRTTTSAPRTIQTTTQPSTFPTLITALPTWTTQTPPPRTTTTTPARITAPPVWVTRTPPPLPTTTTPRRPATTTTAVPPTTTTPFTAGSGDLCDGRILLPCDLMRHLTFGGSNPPQSYRDVAMYAQTLAATARRKRRSASRQCEKRFKYVCPASWLTIEINTRAPPTTSTSASAPSQNYYYDYPPAHYRGKRSVMRYWRRVVANPRPVWRNPNTAAITRRSAAVPHSPQQASSNARQPQRQQSASSILPWWDPQLRTYVTTPCCYGWYAAVDGNCYPYSG